MGDRRLRVFWEWIGGVRRGEGGFGLGEGWSGGGMGWDGMLVVCVMVEAFADLGLRVLNHFKLKSLGVYRSVCFDPLCCHLRSVFPFKQHYLSRPHESAVRKQ